MNKYFICYADENYKQQQLEILSECVGFSKVPYTHRFLLETGFYDKYSRAFTELKNAGCIWKPYIISDLLTHINYGDLIVYIDCGDKILPTYLDFIKNSMRNKDTYFITSNFINRCWTKTYCFKQMGCDEDKYKDTLQLDAGQIGFVKTDFTVKFVSEWLEYCTDLDVLLDDRFDYADYHVIRHSRDQSILTNLQIKYALPTISINDVENKYTIHNFRG